MLKLIGALMIWLAGAGVGMVQAAKLAGRPRQIRQLIQALKLLETEIEYGFTPLPEALQRIGERLEAPTSSIFLSAAENLEGGEHYTAREAWQKALGAIWGRTSMKQNERDIMQRLGFTLGISDREDQVKHILLAITQLQAEEDLARDEQQRYEKMWKSLGMLAGALLVILMY